MSDPGLDSVEEAFREFAAYRNRLRALVNQHAGDENEPVRSMLLAQLFGLDELEGRMRGILSGRVRMALAPIPGERAAPSVRRMQHNTGWAAR